MKVKAVKQIRNRTRTPRKFTVQLTEGDVDFLIALTSAVAGDPVHSPRKYADRILDKLVPAAGYDMEGTDAAKLMMNPGPVEFDNYSELDKPVAVCCVCGDNRCETLRLLPKFFADAS